MQPNNQKTKAYIVKILILSCCLTNILNHQVLIYFYTLFFFLINFKR